MASVVVTPWQPPVAEIRVTFIMPFAAPGFLFKQKAPVSRLATPLPKRQPVWPTVSIVLLLLLAVIMTPLVITVLNSILIGLAIVVFLLTNQALDRRLLYILIPFGLIIFLGMVSGVGVDRYEYFKDLWYVLNPCIVILVGYILFRAKPDLSRGLRIFVVAGLIIALWQVRPYFFKPDIILLPTETIRRMIGTGLYAPVLALVILIVTVGQWRNALRLPPWLGWVFAVLLAVAVGLVFSRTALLIIFVGMAAAAGAFARREWLRVGIPLLVLFYLAFTAQQFIDTGSAWATRTFSGKLMRSVTEMSVGEYIGAREVGMNFRGHETAQAIKQFSGSSPLDMLFGRGFGATVDLGISLPLATNDVGAVINVRFVGVLHNGYMYILTKAGAVGLILYVAVLAALYWMARWRAGLPTHQVHCRAGRLMQFLTVALLTTTYIVGGIFNKLDMFPLLLLVGYLLAYFRFADAADNDSPALAPR
jgi:hypothetical protein